MVTGAFMASVRESSRPDPGGFSSLIQRSQHRTLGSAKQVKASPLPVAPALRAKHSSHVVRLVRSRALAHWRRSSSKSPAPANSPVVIAPIILPAVHSSPLVVSVSRNQTIDFFVTGTFFGPTDYLGPKDLALVDDQRSLVVYNRARSLSLYTGPANYIRFWVDVRNYELIAHVYRVRFQEGSSLFKEYAHLDSANFERWEQQETEDPINVMLASERSILHEVFGLVPSKYLTIGDSNPRLEEQASHVLGHLYALGVVVSLALMALEECSKLRQALAKAPPTSQLRSDSATLRHIESQIPLDEVVEIEPCSADEWWNGEDKATAKVDLVATHFDTSISNTTVTIDPSTPTPIPTQPTLDPTPTAVSSRAAKAMGLAQRPGGPRFKSAAWKRCRRK